MCQCRWPPTPNRCTSPTWVECGRGVGYWLCPGRPHSNAWSVWQSGQTDWAMDHDFHQDSNVQNRFTKHHAWSSHQRKRPLSHLSNRTLLTLLPSRLKKISSYDKISTSLRNATLTNCGAANGRIFIEQEWRDQQESSSNFHWAHWNQHNFVSPAFGSRISMLSSLQRVSRLCSSKRCTFSVVLSRLQHYFCFVVPRRVARCNEEECHMHIALRIANASLFVARIAPPRGLKPQPEKGVCPCRNNSSTLSSLTIQ